MGEEQGQIMQLRSINGVLRCAVSNARWDGGIELLFAGTYRRFSQSLLRLWHYDETKSAFSSPMEGR